MLTYWLPTLPGTAASSPVNTDVPQDRPNPFLTGQYELLEQGALTPDAALKAVPIMAVTAYAGKGDEEQIRTAGAEAYVSKPISVIKFIESVGAFA